MLEMHLNSEFTFYLIFPLFDGNLMFLFFSCLISIADTFFIHLYMFDQKFASMSTLVILFSNGKKIEKKFYFLNGKHNFIAIEGRLKGHAAATWNMCKILPHEWNILWHRLLYIFKRKRLEQKEKKHHHFHAVCCGM